MRFRIHCADPNTGKEFDFEVDAATIQEAEANAQAAGMLVSEVVPVDAPGPSPTAAAVPPNQPSGGRGVGCKVCGRGRLIRRKTYRMSGAVVTIGYILLIPSAIGLLMNLGLFLLPSLGVVASSSLSSLDRKKLVDAAVPTEIIEQINNSSWVSSDDSAIELTDDQRAVVNDIQLTRVQAAGATACCFALTGVTAILGAIICFVSGLLGWLLVMKKVILQCTACRAVTPAG